MTSSRAQGQSRSVVPSVILAAGASRRLGTPKQLVARDGETLLRRIVRTALAGGGPVFVVTGFRSPDMAAELAGLPVQLVVNPAWEEGMGASLRHGVAALPAGSSGVLLLVCDQPAVTPELLEQLQAEHRAAPEALVACAYGGTLGIPALLPARLFPQLLALRGDQGARGLFRGEAVIPITFPEGAQDVDRPEDVRTRACRLFDAHVHIIDPRFPLVANQGFLPEPFTCEDYLERMGGYRLAGGAIVSGSFQAFDQTYLVEALRRLGPGFAGVTQLPATASDGEILALHRAGVRAVRFNLKRGGSEDLGQLERMARRVHDLAGWHVELYVDGRELPALSERIVALPRVSIDHLGLVREGLEPLLRLVERGVRVKATGFGRLDFEAGEVVRQLFELNAEALMFGTDLPSTRAPRAYRDEDFERVLDVLGEAGAAKVFFDNACKWYGGGRASG